MTIHDPRALIPVAVAPLPAIVLALDIERAAGLARMEKALATRIGSVRCATIARG